VIASNTTSAFGAALLRLMFGWLTVVLAVVGNRRRNIEEVKAMQGYGQGTLGFRFNVALQRSDDCVPACGCATAELNQLYVRAAQNPEYDD
jgi:hypothetical protein